MAGIIKTFVQEAILRNKSRKYMVMYRLDDGKYYQSIVHAYSEKDATRIIKRDLRDSSWNEFEPSDYIKKMIEIHDALYVYELEG